MRYRELGRTGFQISEVGFGCGDNAGLMIDGDLNEQCRVVGRAIERGINYFDTAAGYGTHKSEISLGHVLKRLGVRPIINTKVEVDLAQVGDVAAAVVASIEGSLERLQVDCVDIAMIHNSPVFQRPADFRGWLPLTIDEYLGPRGALAGLERLRRDGKARFFGLVNERPDVDLVRRLLDTGQFDLLNVQCNLLNPTAMMPAPSGLRVDLDNGAIISYAAVRGAGVAIFSPMARGVLTDRAVAGCARHPLAGTGVTRNPESYQALLARARTLAFLARDGSSLSQEAARFLLANPGITTILGGFTAAEHVDELAASGMAPLDDVDLARVAMIWRANFGVW
jgi:aryl-alcohol dehydrogenase-like predicted oxidoreductase